MEDADLLSEIIPVLMERNRFRKIYSDNWWYKLKQHLHIWRLLNATIDNGVGDVDVKPVDLLNIFWQPGIEDTGQRQRVHSQTGGYRVIRHISVP